jgi:hypothetical protein
MLSKRWSFWIAVFVVAVTLAACLFLGQSTPGKVSRENFDKIQIGMTYREVNRLLDKDDEDDEDEPMKDVSATWYDDPYGLTIVVYFDEEGKASSKTLIPAEPFRTLRRKLLGY